MSFSTYRSRKSRIEAKETSTNSDPHSDSVEHTALTVSSAASCPLLSPLSPRIPECVVDSRFMSKRKRAFHAAPRPQ